MATRAVTNCAVCGEVKLDFSDITYYPVERVYAFVCPHCGASNERRADDKIGKLLADNGARVKSSLPDPDLFGALLETESGDQLLYHWIGGEDEASV